jgi:hypothetical protein
VVEDFGLQVAVEVQVRGQVHTDHILLPVEDLVDLLREGGIVEYPYMVLELMQYLLQVVKQTLVVEEEVMEMLLQHQVVPE